MISTPKLRSDRGLGFTLVEILVVIVAISILAGISIMAYNGIQNKAEASRLKSDLVDAGNFLERECLRNDSCPDVDTQSGQIRGHEGNYFRPSPGVEIRSYSRNDAAVGGTDFCITLASTTRDVDPWHICSGMSAPESGDAPSSV